MSSPSVAASSRSAAAIIRAAVPASGSPTMRAYWSRAPARRASSSASGVVFAQPPDTARSAIAGLKAANTPETTRQGAAPRHALRLQK